MKTQVAIHWENNNNSDDDSIIIIIIICIIIIIIIIIRKFKIQKSQILYTVFVSCLSSHSVDRRIKWKITTLNAKQVSSTECVISVRIKDIQSQLGLRDWGFVIEYVYTL